MIVYFEHGYYGCDSGCCGTLFYLVDADGKEVRERFEFSHSLDEAKRFAAKWAAEHGATVDESRCKDPDEKCCW